MTELENYINSYFGISNAQVNNLSTFFTRSTIEKGAYLVKKDKYCTQLSFLRSGYLRVFNDYGSKEITQWICSPGDFVTDLSSIIFQRASKWNIQALTECELYTISSEDYANIGKYVSQWDRIEKLFIAKCFLTLEDRVYSFLAMTAEERFQLMHQIKPELFNAVPLHYIASMLGMTPETLSRIRNKISS